MIRVQRWLRCTQRILSLFSSCLQKIKNFSCTFSMFPKMMKTKQRTLKLFTYLKCNFSRCAFVFVQTSHSHDANPFSSFYFGKILTFRWHFSPHVRKIEFLNQQTDWTQINCIRPDVFMWMQFDGFCVYVRTFACKHRAFVKRTTHPELIIQLVRGSVSAFNTFITNVYYKHITKFMTCNMAINEKSNYFLWLCR